MPRLKFDEDELDDDLDDLEYDDSQSQRYDGDQPPKGTYLRGYIKSLWMTETKSGDRMMKVLFVADGNDGKEGKYEGLPVWENLALTAGAKFKWGPFFKHFGLTIKLLKTKTIIAADDDNIGAPIIKIGTALTPGEESANARCAIITSREKYNDDWQTHVAEWLDDEEPEDEDEEEDEEQEDDEEEEQEDEEEEEEEEDEEPEPPAKPTRPTAKKPAAASTPKSSVPKAAAARPSAKSPVAKTGTKSTSGAGGRTSSAKTATKAAPARGARRGKAAGYDEEPPF